MKDNTSITLQSSLPKKCFSVHPSKKTMIFIERGRMGVDLTPVAFFHGKTPRQSADVLNANMSVTRAQEAAMLGGATQGWDTPAADPKNYDEKGRPIKPRHRDRGDAR